jgi:pilus assembly protein CpaB
MNNRVLVILLSAFLLATGCSYIVYRAFSSRSDHPAATTVVVAASDIKLGSILRDADLKTAEVSGTPPKGAILRRQDAIGRGVVSNLYEGEPIIDSRLAAPGSGGGLAATIPPGMRACAVKVDDVVGVAGFVTPGMKIDVLISGHPPGDADPTQGSKVKTLLQNIEVLSAGTDIQKDGGGKPQQVRVVNLLVTPEQAEDLALASNEMRIQLVLRNPLDTQITDPGETAMGALFAGASAPPPKPHPTGVVHVAPSPKPVAQTYSVQVFNGTKQSEAKFNVGEDK